MCCLRALALETLSRRFLPVRTSIRVCSYVCSWVCNELPPRTCIRDAISSLSACSCMCTLCVCAYVCCAKRGGGWMCIRAWVFERCAVVPPHTCIRDTISSFSACACEYVCMCVCVCVCVCMCTSVMLFVCVCACACGEGGEWLWVYVRTCVQCVAFKRLYARSHPSACVYEYV